MFNREIQVNQYQKYKPKINRVVVGVFAPIRLVSHSREIIPENKDYNSKNRQEPDK